VLTSDAPSDERFADRRSIVDLKIVSALCVPVRSGDRVMGFLYVDSNTATGAFEEDDLKLLAAIGIQAGIAIENHEFHLEALERERMQRELAIAREIQQGLLPAAAPNVPGLELAGLSVACEETGGDYYDFITFPSGEVGLVVGDVSGHGLGAAMYMATTRTMLHAVWLEAGDLVQALDRTNALLCRDMLEGRFVTLFAGFVSRDRRRLSYLAAGHPGPTVYRADGRVEETQSTDIPLGVAGGHEFGEPREIEIGPGDVLFLGTDGVWEAHDKSDREFGSERLKEAVGSLRDRSPREIVRSVHETVLAFVGGARFADDVTCVAASVLGPEARRPQGDG
jgi:sigma-B regulation protein RsbU (phosphoserine phosphatase)